jgi:hypothetical protein
MRTFLLALLSLNTALLCAQDANIEARDRSPVEAKFSSGGQLSLDLCSGGVNLKGIDENLLRVSYHSEHDRTDDVRVHLETSGGKADVKVRGCPHNNFWLTVELPKSSDLYVRMFAGELNVKGITGNKDVQLHFGQLTMEIGQPGDYAHVDGSVNSGELDAAPFDLNKGGLFRSFERSGPGKYRLHAHVGAGELDLR